MKTLELPTTSRLHIDPELARRLPRELALRLQVVPVARANGRITVAMADPDDMETRDAVADVLGGRPYVVHAEPAAIDRLLTEIWSKGALAPLRLLVYHQSSPLNEELEAYAQFLGDLLGAELTYFQASGQPDTSIHGLIEEAICKQDLVIFEEPSQTFIERVLSRPGSCKSPDRISTSELIVRQPRLPINKVLLVARGTSLDNVAVEWVVRLSQRSNASVTILATVPPISATDDAASQIDNGLADQLAAETILRRQMRLIGWQMEHWGIEGSLRFREGSPARQIMRETIEGNHDLIVMGADPKDGWLRHLLGETVCPLLRWADRPVLIARPTTSSVKRDLWITPRGALLKQ